MHHSLSLHFLLLWLLISNFKQGSVQKICVLHIKKLQQFLKTMLHLEHLVRVFRCFLLAYALAEFRDQERCIMRFGLNQTKGSGYCFELSDPGHALNQSTGLLQVVEDSVDVPLQGLARTVGPHEVELIEQTGEFKVLAGELLHFLKLPLKHLALPKGHTKEKVAQSQSVALKNSLQNLLLGTSQILDKSGCLAE